MVKMKVKKEMTLPELIKWAGKNRIKNKRFLGSSGGGLYFYFDEDSWISIDDPNLIESDETFEVEVEEEITEQSVIPKLVVIYDDGYAIHTTTFQDTSIDTVLSDETVENGERIAFYMLNDDMTMTLLWRNGGMVE